MLVRRFKFKRNHDKGGFNWTAESEIERPGFYRGFHAVGKALSDVKEFAALVRKCERTGSLERLSEMHPDGFESRMQTTWGGNWHPHKRKAGTALSTRTGKERSPSDLAQINERNVGLCRVKPDGTVEGLEAEDILADFIRAESRLGPNIPAKIRSVS